MKALFMGNEAIAFGALDSGVAVVTGYPGTPSSEILDTVAKHNAEGRVYVEWSVNEKAALEVAAGAAYSGARTLVTMKQVGLNVASDPLMSLAYVGVKGGMVIVVADDPGPISSQTEQDTRHWAAFAKLPVFDPSTVEEAYSIVGKAFEYSERHRTPVLLRPTTRVCHGYATMERAPAANAVPPVRGDGFVKDSKWVIFPRLAYLSHLEMEKRNVALCDEFSDDPLNVLTTVGTADSAQSRIGVAVGGVSYAYAMETLGTFERGVQLLKVTTPHPFPERLAVDFLKGVDEVLVVEELDPVIERQLVYLCGKHRLNVAIKGKLTNDMPNAGEYTVDGVKRALYDFAGIAYDAPQLPESIPLAVRPPVLCKGCPHHASFSAVKQAMEGKSAVFCGDIGCYTLGNAHPLNMVDTCLCMGAGITVAQGLQRTNENTTHFAFIGDGTFFHSGITGVINALYNHTDIVVVILDNSTTAMTGGQPHPGTGRTMMGESSPRISIRKVLEAIGVPHIEVCNPYDKSAVDCVKRMAELGGVRAILFEAPCVSIKGVKA